jgi:type IV pilus assembly protein PilW
MKQIIPASYFSARHINHTAGFTLIELIMVIALTSIMGLAILLNYQSQTRTYRVQRELANMQQNMRAAMFLLQQDIRNSGRDPERSGQFGIQSIADDANNNASLTMTRLLDTDNDGMADVGAVETIVYQLADPDGDGRQELQRCLNGVCQRIVDGVASMGFAYAYDDGSEDLARFNGNPANTEIWAYDGNGTNTLNTSADSDGDGDIDIDDVPAGLGENIALNRIRVVRIWLLARSRLAYPNFSDTNTYILGDRMLNLAATNNAPWRNFRHFLLSGAVSLQNYQLSTNL